MAWIPCNAVSRKPLYLAIRIEKEVRGISAGMIAATSRNTWLSVMTRAGADMVCIVRASSGGRQHATMPPASNASRSTCCCGRMSRPFGADSSKGSTRMIWSPG